MKEWWFQRLIYCVYSTNKEKTKEKTSKEVINKKEMKNTQKQQTNNNKQTYKQKKWQ